MGLQDRSRSQGGALKCLSVSPLSTVQSVKLGLLGHEELIARDGRGQCVLQAVRPPEGVSPAGAVGRSRGEIGVDEQGAGHCDGSDKAENQRGADVNLHGVGSVGDGGAPCVWSGMQLRKGVTRYNPVDGVDNGRHSEAEPQVCWGNRRPSVSGGCMRTRETSVTSFVLALCLLSATPTFAQMTTLVSESFSVPGTGNGGCFIGDLSADGLTAVFIGFASDHVPNDTNGAQDLFVRDLASGTTVRIYEDTDGQLGTGHPQQFPELSADGGHAVFRTDAALVAADTDFVVDAYVIDIAAGTTSLVSVDLSGNPAFTGVSAVDVSGDGQLVAFSAYLPVLGAGLFLRDMPGGVTEEVSVDELGVLMRGDNPQLTTDGRTIAFDSVDDLLPGDTNGVDVFVRDMDLGVTEFISVSTAGVQANSSCLAEHISADGRFVVFSSGADNLVAGDTNVEWDVFVRDRLLNLTERVSVASDGTQGNNQSWRGSISADGRFVAFESRSDGFGASNSGNHIYVRDRSLSLTYQVDVNSAGMGDTWSSGNPTISDDGSAVLLGAASPNFAPPDNNNSTDAFVHTRFWTDLGEGLSGSTTPRLLGAGSLLSGSTATWAFHDGPPSSMTLWIFGFVQNSVPFKGGTLVPSVDVILPMLSDASGAWIHQLVVPAILPVGMSTYFQVIVADGGAPSGFALSNALRGRSF